MAGKDGRRKHKTKNRTPRRPKGSPAAQPLHQQGAPDLLSELPGQSNAQAARLAAVQQLQRQLGNAVVQRQITRQMAGDLMRQEDEGTAVKLPDPKSLRVIKDLEGHPSGLAIQREEAAEEAATEDAAADEGAAEDAEISPTADITLKIKDPKINRISEKKVQEKHGKENIAGYTKPAIEISVQKLKQHEIKLTVTITFEMDLAKEYKGGRLQVLRDHENAHMLIAEKVANEFVVGPVKDGLEAMPEFTEANKGEIKALFEAKALDFDKEEGDASELFDDMDYPRMDEAYYGVATPLADLSSGSAEVKKMVETVDAFNEGAKGAAGDTEALGGLIQPLVEAQETLGEANLARLQYNDEFKEKVAKAQKVVAGLLGKKSDELPAEVKTQLEELAPALEKFTWEPEIP